MLDEIVINGMKYRRVKDEKGDRPVNFNPFDVSEKDEVFLFPNGIIVTEGSTAWYYTEERKKELIDNALVVKDKQVALSIEFRYNIMRKLLKYGYEHKCLWNGEGRAYTIGYTRKRNPAAVEFTVIPWTNRCDICNIAFNNEEDCYSAIRTIVTQEYIKAQNDAKKLYKKEEWCQ